MLRRVCCLLPFALGARALSTSAIALGSHRGMLERFNSEKGFGFLRDQDSNRFFFHVRSLIDFDPTCKPKNGDILTFDAVSTGKVTLEARNSEIVEKCDVEGGSDENRKKYGVTDEAPRKRTMAPRGERTEGVVEFFNQSRGYGFVSDNNQNRFFVHRKNFTGNLNPNNRDDAQLVAGDIVSFVPETSLQGNSDIARDIEKKEASQV